MIDLEIFLSLVRQGFKFEMIQTPGGEFLEIQFGNTYVRSGVVGLRSSGNAGHTIQSACEELKRFKKQVNEA